MATTHPVAIRFTADDWEILDELRARTGLTVPGVLRLAIRALRDQGRPAPRATKSARKLRGGITKGTKKGDK